MKSTIIKSLLLALVATLVSQSTNAEDGKSGLVAVLDVAKVFKENQGFDAKMKAIKSEADTLKAKITQEQEAIKSRAQQLGQWEVGAPERNKLEAELEQEQAALRTRARQAEADLLNREARIYYNTYNEMQNPSFSPGIPHPTANKPPGQPYCNTPDCNPALGLLAAGSPSYLRCPSDNWEGGSPYFTS